MLVSSQMHTKLHDGLNQYVRIEANKNVIKYGIGHGWVRTKIGAFSMKVVPCPTIIITKVPTYSANYNQSRVIFKYGIQASV